MKNLLLLLLPSTANHTLISTNTNPITASTSEPTINKMAWGDEAEDPSPEEQFEPAAPAGRPRLNLMPRGATAAAGATAGAAAAAAGGGGSSKSNPFGAAKPREEGTYR